MKTGVIGGTGMHELFYKQPGAKLLEHRLERTPYGGPVIFYEVFLPMFQKYDLNIYYLNRHLASGEHRLPHMLFHEAYMYGLLRDLRAEAILATSAVGAIKGSLNAYKPGDLVLPSRTINYVAEAYTFARPNYCHPTAFHRPINFLFCPHLRQRMLAHLRQLNSAPVLANSIKGPAFESQVEIDVRRRDGVDLVGMPTAYPEAVLAGEASVPYGLLCGVSNMAPAEHDGQAVAQVMAGMQMPIFNTLISTIFGIYAEGEVHPKDCPCRQDREVSVFDILGEPSF